ncbi:MAG: general secretion pathway protein GspK [Gemmatimonadaceae bacterium]|nr:general secretion pathway protein GspK [Gemmatimonadaceae bacterium]
MRARRSRPVRRRGTMDADRSVRSRAARRGFVLLAVLWVMVGVTALGLALALAARRAIAAARNRRAATAAEWAAEDCLERSRALIADALTAHTSTANDARHDWRTLDGLLRDAPLLTARGCDIRLRGAGWALDVNAADAEQLARFFTALGVPTWRVDSLVDAVLDWRDPDDVARPAGAERAWYAGQGRRAPRDGPFADVRELARVRGLEVWSGALAGLDTLVGVEPGRIDLNRAPLPVLASLPGLGAEALARLAEHRVRGAPVSDVLALSAELSPNARAALVARYADLVRLTTTEPDAWIVTSRARAGQPSITAAIEVRLVRAGTRAAIVRRRTWLE